MTFTSTIGATNGDDEMQTPSWNEMPRGGIQHLRDFLVAELSIADPSHNGYGNLIENVVTVLKKNERILWGRPPEPAVMVLSPTELRALAGQAEAYRLLKNSGADAPDTGSVLIVYGRPLGFVLHTYDATLVEIVTQDGLGGRLDWMTVSERYEKYRDDILDVES